MSVLKVIEAKEQFIKEYSKKKEILDDFII